MIKCTGLNCPMQVGKVDPATCKAADTCEWATKPLTNADRIRNMSDEELAYFLTGVQTDVCEKIGAARGMPFEYTYEEINNISLQWQTILKKEVEQ